MGLRQLPESRCKKSIAAILVGPSAEDFLDLEFGVVAGEPLHLRFALIA